MKRQILNLKKKLLLVELPEKINGEDVSINHSQDDYDQLEFQYPTHDFRGLQCYDNILLPKGNNHKPVGKLTDITEEQFKEWVEKFNNGAVRDYREQVLLFDPADDLANFCLTAKESFFSYLESQQIYFENKLGKKPEVKSNDYFLEYANIKKLKLWEESEQKVWVRDRCYIFEIV